MTTIRDLVTAARRRGLHPTDRDRPLSDIAKDCGTSVSYLYGIMAGDYPTLREWRVAMLAAGLGVTQRKLLQALEATRQEALAQ